MKKLILFAGVCALILTGPVGCDSGSGGGGGGGGTVDPDEGKVFTEAISAAEGGVVSTDSGSASVDIPAGALPEDVEITIAVESSDGETVASIYDFGPDGTVFNEPVTIGIAYDGNRGKDMKAVLAWKDGDTWVEIPGSGVEGGDVVGSIDHFTKFSIIIVDDQVILTSECSDVPAEFAPCGGDVVGTWEIEDLCFEDTVIGQNPFEESCPEAIAEFEVIWTGSVTIDGTTITNNLESMSMTMDATLPMTCLQEGQCEEMLEDDCSVQGDNCVCHSEDVSTQFEQSVQTYTIDGNNLVITDEDGETESSPYCRQGSSLVVKLTDMDDEGGPQVWYMVLTKQ